MKIPKLYLIVHLDLVITINFFLLFLFYFVLTQFLIGERACVGSRMTFIESKVVLAKFLRKYRIMAHNAPVEEVMQITMAPRGLKVYLEAR